MDKFEDFTPKPKSSDNSAKKLNGINIIAQQYQSNTPNGSDVSQADFNAVKYAPEIMKQAVENLVKTEYQDLKDKIEKVIKEIP